MAFWYHFCKQQFTDAKDVAGGEDQPVCCDDISKLAVLITNHSFGADNYGSMLAKVVMELVYRRSFVGCTLESFGTVMTC